jgi:geranylgeranyl pyrophosphate synthase
MRTLQSEPLPLETRPGLDHDILASHLRQAVKGVVGPPSFHEFLWSLLEERLLSGTEQESLSLLPSFTCWACGKAAADAYSVTAAWQLVRLSAKILDDIEDEQCHDPVGPLANAAVALLTLAQQILQRSSPLSKVQIRQLLTGLQQAMLNAAAGQHVDLMTRTEAGSACLDPSGWLDVALAKTGALVAWAAEAGAIVAGAPSITVAAYATYGRHLGVLLQLADDFNDAWREDLPTDLIHAHLNLAVTYALWVGSESQVTLLRSQLRAARTGQRETLSAVRELLVDMGAQAYFVTIAELHRQNAAAALERAAPHSDQGSVVLRDLLGRTFPDPLARRI